MSEVREIHVSPCSNLVTEVQASKILGFTIRALQAWRTSGKGPKFIKISSRAVRYRLSDLEQWISSKERCSTSSCQNG